VDHLTNVDHLTPTGTETTSDVLEESSIGKEQSSPEGSLPPCQTPQIDPVESQTYKTLVLTYGEDESLGLHCQSQA
jgi:hypothetical protein